MNFLKDLVKALDAPLYVSCGMLLASLLLWKNLFAEDTILFIISFISIWAGNYFVKRYKRKKRENQQT